ncbi:unnamed protein product [Miscanthus lutarioriparius]|uniref:Uncharacterized protein n=1 Tax=Miscanthus lutarioriparius TaxID=422564 RepID=A0A811QNL2_9POAL|nr:unnamed protein product [Miscanthus lutarioriparius]
MHKVKDLRRLYWTHNNLTVMDVTPLWNHSSDALLYAHHPSHMVDLNKTQNPDGFSHCHELGRQAPHFLVNGVSWGNLDAKGSIPRKQVFQRDEVLLSQMDLNKTQNPDDFSHCHELGRQAPHFLVNGVSWGNLDAKGSIPRKPDSCSVQGNSGCHYIIDLEKPATLDCGVQGKSGCHYIIDLEKPATLDCSVQGKSGCHYIIDLEKPATLDDEDADYANHNGGLSDNSQSVPLDSSLVMRGHLCTDQSAPYVTSGSVGSSDTPDSHSPARTKNTASGRMFIDLNVAQEDDFNFCPDPSKLVCSTSTSSATRQSGGFCNNSSKTFLKGSESSIGSSKGSSVTVATTITVPDSSREVLAAGVFRDCQSHKPFFMETSNPLPRKNSHHQMISRLESQGCMEMEVPRKGLSVRSSGENNSYSGLTKLGGSQATNLMGQVQAAVVVHRDNQEETITVISDHKVEGFDLNVAVESTDCPANFESSYLRQHVNNDDRHCLAQNEAQQNIAPIECPISRNQNMVAKSTDGEDVRSPVSGIAINRSVVIPETPQGRDYACPRSRSSCNAASVAPEAVSFDETEMGEDEKTAATAAETLVSMFASNSARLTDGPGSNGETDAEDAMQEPAPSLNSFEESILSLEEMKDDGESVLVRAPDNNGPSCGIKLKRGRGLRDFQREILPGLVSLARHEICNDLHSIGYEIRKSRLRRSPGDEGSPPTRIRLPRRCSTAWNR